MEMLVTKFSKGKYKNELELFEEPISAENVKLMSEMIALQALRTVKKYDLKIADKLYMPFNFISHRKSNRSRTVAFLLYRQPTIRVTFYPFRVSFYPLWVQKVSVLSTKVTVLA